MRAIKRINNNVVLCKSKNGIEFIARGKGIGFHDFPYELNVKDVERTYYDVDYSYVTMINEIPENILDIATLIIDKARNVLENPLSSNIIFTLADHINFTIERKQKNMNVKLPIIHDIEHLFEKEYELGKYGLKLIKEKIHIVLPKEEAAYIALHIINAEERLRNQNTMDDVIIEKITAIIEKEYDLVIDRSDFNYSRFVSHMYYLLKRGKSKHLIQTENDKLYQTIKENYQKAYQCSEEISLYLRRHLDLKLTDEEKLYLVLHINRLCTREECYR